MTEGDLWMDELPLCDPCLDGEHDRCPDLMLYPGFALLACGCSDPSHDDPGAEQ